MWYYECSALKSPLDYEQGTLTQRKLLQQLTIVQDEQQASIWLGKNNKVFLSRKKVGGVFFNSFTNYRRFPPERFFSGSHWGWKKSDPKQFFGPIFLRLGKKSCLEGFWRPNVWSSGSQESVFSKQFLNRKKLFVSSDFFCCHRTALVTSLKQ